MYHKCLSFLTRPCVISPAVSALAVDPSAPTIQTVYAYVWCCSRVCTRPHHQSGYTDISYVGPVTSLLCRQPRLWHPSDVDEDGRRVLSVAGPRAWNAHFLLTSVVHPAWTLLRSVSHNNNNNNNNNLPLITSVFCCLRAITTFLSLVYPVIC